MASYNLNEELKARKARLEAEAKKARAEGDAVTEEEEIDLGDVSRVKVLSPGRQVFKRFIRNRLAVLGSAILIVMFLFSFIGPLFYPYGQKQIFYKYDRQNVNYALAKENTAFNGYDVDADIAVPRSIVNAMNSNIKKMIADGNEEMLLVENEGGYLIRCTFPGIYTLSEQELTLLCSTGENEMKVGTYTAVGKKFAFAGEEIDGVAEEAAKSIKGAQGSFTVDGNEYTFTKGAKPKTFDVFTVRNGLVLAEGAQEALEGTKLAKEKNLEEALGSLVDEAIAAGEESLIIDDVKCIIRSGKESSDVYLAGEAKTAKVYTSYTMDTYETGATVPKELRAAALMAAGQSDTFEYDGKTWKLDMSDGRVDIIDPEGKEYAELSAFSIRRYSGEDTMAYDLKKAVARKIEEMLASGEKSGTMMADIPMQDENGAYSTDEDGNYVYNQEELKITQRLEGEYVINCDQINYVIDIFGAPSRAHVLGTDGDGFDVLARIMYGGRISLMVGFIVVIIETILGVIMGGIAGYFGGWVDNLIMRMVDVFYCLPSMPIMIILGAMMDAVRMDTYIRLMVMMAALGLMGWAGVARLVRGQILSLREQEFMVATEATGIRIKDRIFRHLVPNVMPQLIVTATMGLGGVIITESTLSFLGLGVKHPLATWGTIINSVSSASAMAHYAFIWIPVGLLICLTVIAFNFVGDGLRDAYDPKAKR